MMRHNRVARHHYRSSYFCGLEASTESARLCTERKWLEALLAMELALDCFLGSKHPHAPVYASEARKCAAIIRKQIESEEYAAAHAVDSMPGYGSLPT